MDERQKFIARVLDGEKMAVLCRDFGFTTLSHRRRPPGCGNRRLSWIQPSARRCERGATGSQW
ncbi:MULTISPECIES: hypothetical protein [unclassified Mesorhizobium]|uniref:hypothetical protein n=1 Tax=unclassified Mesorhizobium TaxID=325217 RepID=UPI000FD375F0|nr:MULTISPECIES: hypothetical protein [unclassified Mesorhizobium]RVB76350.1 hypothetical protein EN885_16570 [Mesorhizobium sp. M6A.T.Cr.TU.014.01.1.1]RWQ04433.1 MAG: hypothetical protein EOR91_17545 [Mesorhizobium sp.]RWQ04709.1 MAG: hypothetical protein EOR90_15660 [Mesorhizobium sp.]